MEEIEYEAELTFNNVLSPSLNPLGGVYSINENHSSYYIRPIKCQTVY